MQSQSVRGQKPGQSKQNQGFVYQEVRNEGFEGTRSLEPCPDHMVIFPKAGRKAIPTPDPQGCHMAVNPSLDIRGLSGALAA